ncbi:MAG: VWA domain-containing protein [Myxococcales bacterium]|nr:VWA domain-containing protein [Myxococcales bacterium]
MRAFLGLLLSVPLVLLACSSEDEGGIAGGGKGGVGAVGGGGAGGSGGSLGKPCSKTSDCGSGKFCSVAKQCVDNGSCGADGDCTAPQVCGLGSKKCLEAGTCATDGDCDQNQVCNVQTKLCEIGGGCGKSVFELTELPPNLMILLDRSGSMSGDAGGSTRWNVAKQAVSQVTTKFDAQLRFGLATYSSCASGGCSAGSIVVPIADKNAATINAFLGSTVDQGSSNGQGKTSSGLLKYLCDSGNPETSTGKSLAALVGQSSLQDPSRTNAVLLLTDGSESGECKGSCDGPCGAAKLLAQNPPVKTYVIGLGVNPSAIDQIAAAGGTTKSVPASNQTELDAAFNKIAAAVASCEYLLDKAPPNSTGVYVYFNDDPTGVPSDPNNGWSYDPTTNKLTFNGTACTQLKSGTVTDIDVVYGCPGPVVN